VLAAVLALAALPAAQLAAGLRARARWSVAAGAAIPALALALAAAGLPHASPERPQVLPLVFHQDADAGEGRWLAVPQDGRLPESLRRVAPFGARPAPAFAWMQVPAFSAPAPRLALAPPELGILTAQRLGAERRVRARLRSARGASDLMLFLPPEAPVVSVTMEGRAVPAPRKRFALLGRHRLVRCTTAPPEGVELELTFRGEAAVEATLVDQTDGLPPGGERLRAARPPSAVAVQDGDATVVVRRVKL
jgi:hypothetical protein